MITPKLLIGLAALVFYLLAFLGVPAPRSANWFYGAVGLSFLYLII